jgi:hypothetical protein
MKGTTSDIFWTKSVCYLYILVKYLTILRLSSHMLFTQKKKKEKQLISHMFFGFEYLIFLSKYNKLT